MKKLKLAVIASCLTATIANPLFAADLAPNPKICPAPGEIRRAGLMTAELDAEDGFYLAGQISAYATRYTWAFVIGIPLQAASSVDDALNKARAALPGLTGRPTPISYQGRWVCPYNDLPGGYKAIAVTPVNLSATTHGSAFKVNQQ